MEVKISGRLILIDPSDWDRLKSYKWAVFKNGKHLSVRCRLKSCVKLLHRELLLSLQPEDRVIFKNGNRLDFRRENLIVTTIGAVTSSTLVGTRGYRGVSYQNGRWRVRIGGMFVGTFDCPEKAARSYDRKAIELYGAAAILNFST